MNNSKAKKWEYWPSWAFYLPNIPYAIFLAIKAKNLTFFSAANPAIEGSGNGAESKFETSLLIPKKYRPNSILVDASFKKEQINKLLKEANIQYPIIAKPDIGFRGLLVKKINTSQELNEYLTNNQEIKIILQEFINYKNECGIFYYRYPDKQKGVVSSITLKKFLSVTGNGASTIEELIKNDQRAKRYLKLIKNNKEINLTNIPKKDKKVKLSIIGNHAKGTQFINGNHLINNKITEVFDKISHEMNGWHYGRIDLKYNSFEDIGNENFKILEVNGILAEPTHIYDSTKTTFLQALKTIRQYWRILYNISIINIQNKELEHSDTKNFIRNMKKIRIQAKKNKI